MAKINTAVKWKIGDFAWKDGSVVEISDIAPDEYLQLNQFDIQDDSLEQVGIVGGHLLPELRRIDDPIALLYIELLRCERKRDTLKAQMVECKRMAESLRFAISVISRKEPA